MAGTLLFVLGLAAVFTSHGGAFEAAGTLLLTHQDLIIKVLGAFTLVLGLIFTGALARVPLLSQSFRVSFQPRLGVASAPLLGVLFGVGWTRCIGRRRPPCCPCPSATAAPVEGAAVVPCSVGLGLPFLLAAMGVQRCGHHAGQRHLHRTDHPPAVLVAGWQTPLEPRSLGALGRGRCAPTA